MPITIIPTNDPLASGTTANDVYDPAPVQLNSLIEMNVRARYAFPLELKNDRKGHPFVNLRVVPPFTKIRHSHLNIALFMPASMQIGYSAMWEDIDLGPMSNMAIQAAEGSGDLVDKAIAAATASVYGTAGRKAGDFLGTNTQAALQMSQRIMVNPHAALMFKNMAFREFMLTWNLFPKSDKESKEVRDIIFQLKYAMHPGEEQGSGTFNQATMSNFFGIPQNFIISFYAPNLRSLVKTHPCALINCNVEYNGAGVPAYFSNNRPACITLSLHFKEMAVLTKGDIVAGW